VSSLVQPAPGRLELVRSLVNTRDVDLGTDVLVDAADLRRWARAHGFDADGASDPDVHRVRALREALRAGLAANHEGAALPRDAAATIDGCARWAGAGVTFADGPGWSIVSASAGVREMLAGLLDIVAHSMSDGSWRRLKTCHNDSCQWAFYDGSRTHTAKWCSMRICGNRLKQSAWRARAASR
jgi:predicted RNA-binding Zn ribbon-like protein